MATSPAAPARGARAGALGLVDLLPERVEIEHEPRAARHAHAPAPRGAGDRVAAVAAQLVDFEAAELRVDDRVETDTRPRIVPQLVHTVAVHIPRSRRRDLGDQVWRHSNE